MTNCRVDDGLVRELTALNAKLNTLSPSWERDAEKRNEIEEQRETLRVELKDHRKKGHDGRKCPAFDPRFYAATASR